MIAGLLSCTVPVRAAQGTDITDELIDYVAKDRAYSPAARLRAGELIRISGRGWKTPAEAALGAARIAALSNNGHSNFLPGQWASRFARSPVHFGLFADGLFVITAPPPYHRLLHRRVVSIEGQPWRKVRRYYSQYQGGLQSFRDQFVTYFMESPELLAAAGLSRDAHNLHFLVEHANGKRELIVVPGRPEPIQDEFAALLGASTLLEAARSARSGEIPLYLQEPEQDFRLRFLSDGDAAYIQLRSNRGDGLKDFVRQSLATLRGRRLKNIVLDLRFNMGGDLNLTRELAQALPSLADGQIFAITSGRTFSAGISNLAYLKQAAGKRLTIVGEPVGDRLEFWAEGDTVDLKDLGFSLLYATERHNYMTGCPEVDCHAAVRKHPIRVRHLQPDLAAPLRFSDFLKGRDVAMEAIAKVARFKPDR